MRLLGDNTERLESIQEASQWQSGHQLRELFVTILLFCTITDQAQFLWEYFPFLSEDGAYNQRRFLQNEELLFSDEELVHYSLLHIDDILNGNGRSLIDFPNLPQIDHRLLNIGSHRLIVGECAYNVQEERLCFDALYSALIMKQNEVYTAIMNVVAEKKRGFFLFGCGGTGKMYSWRTLIASICSQGKIVLVVASSGIASLLLPGGCTTHLRFNIPIDLDHDSCCSIDVGTNLAKLINIAELIIWDEAPL